jgi:hypothetical protein
LIETNQTVIRVCDAVEAEQRDSNRTTIDLPALPPRRRVN